MGNLPPRTLEARITKQDICTGVPGDGVDCAIGLRIAKDFDQKNAWIDQNGTVEIKGFRYELDNASYRWMNRFDDGQAVRPRTVRLTLIER